jgi:hypothetical protein
VLYFAASLVGILHHELWLDEAHHWLLARDSISFSDLLANSRLEGHPILWDALVFIVSRFTRNPIGMQLLQLVVSTVTVWIFLKKAPFGLVFKTLFIFGYFMFFEYNLISRNYMLGLFFLFLSATCCSQRERKFIPLMLCLALAMNVHLMFAVIGIALFLVIVWEHFQNKTLSNVPHLLGYLIFTAGFGLLILQVSTTDSGWFFNSLKGIPIEDRFTKGFISLFKGLVTIPDFTTIHFWNSNAIVDFSKPVAAILGLLAYGIPLILFYRKPKTLCFVYVALIGTQIFFLITQRSATRFDGLNWIIITIALWIENDLDNRANSRVFGFVQKPIIYGILGLQFCSGIYAFAMDVRYPFTNAKLAVGYLKTQPFDSQDWISLSCDGTPISAYAQKQIWFLCDGKLSGACDWRQNCSKDLTPSKITDMISAYMDSHENAVYISCEPAIPKAIPNIWIKINDKIKVRLLKKFDHAIIRTDCYYIFEISRI